MTLCYLNHDMKPYTGAGRFGRELIGHMRQALPEARITVLTTEASGFPGERPLIPTGWRSTLRAMPAIRAALASCGIVHALDGWPYGVVAALGLLGSRGKLVITAVGSGAIRPFAHPLRGQLLRWAYRRADRLVAVSSYTERELLSRDPTLSIEVVNHGVDFARFSQDAFAKLPPERQEEIRRLRPYLMSVGGKPRKGFAYSIPAYAKLRHRFPDLHYVMVGDVNRGLIGQWIAESGVAEGIAVLPRIDDAFLIALYQQAELFLLLPQNVEGDIEGFGLVFLEAAAAGLPAVAARGSGAEDAVRDGETGFVVAPENAEAAANACATILASPELRRTLSERARAFAAERDWAAVAARYRDLYSGLMR